MTSITKLHPPANISDLESRTKLLDEWSEFLSNQFDLEIKSLTDNDKVLSSDVGFFNPTNKPPGQSSIAHITWQGFPNILIAKLGKQKAYEVADQLKSFIMYSDIDGNNELKFNHRNQDEVLGVGS